MNFELFNYYPPALVDDTEVLERAIKSNRCFVTLGQGIYVFEFIVEGYEFRYITHSTERYDSICEALRQNSVAIIAGNETFQFTFGLAIAILFGLLIFALVR